MIEETVKQAADYCLGCKTKPCKVKCPLSNNIPEFINCIKEENIEKAWEELTKTTVLSAVCGKICPHTKQCQSNCTRGIKKLKPPVNIGMLEEFVGKQALENNCKFSKFENYNENIKKNKKVAVVGSGPAGLTAAAFLARSGVHVTIYEKHEELGGILRHGIPDFRLDKDILNLLINRIIEIGNIEVEKGKELGKNITLEELEKKYDAIYLGIGANCSKIMNVEGSELLGVYGANEVLENKTRLNLEGKKVAVIGGGNVAMDISRTIKRQGAADVTVIYRRQEEQMPAEEIEIKEAKEEGINFLFKTNIVKILPDEDLNKVAKIECIKTELIQKEGETRLSPVNIENSNYLLDMDFVFFAVGSKTEERAIKSIGLELNNGYIKVDENYKTSNNKVYAGGDLIGQNATVAWAARSGRDAAYAIINSIC